MNNWVVVTDFDGTLTTKDVGNELCKKFIPEKFARLHRDYKAGKYSLLDYQVEMWSDFPAALPEFLQTVDEVAELRPGVLEFLTDCRKKKIPVHIASCGLRPYIERVLQTKLKDHFDYLKDSIHCNEVELLSNFIHRIRPSRISKDGKYPVDKGEISESFRPLKVLGIGNGTSDRTFLGSVDILAATEGLQTYCEEQNYPHISFFDFHDLMKHKII